MGADFLRNADDAHRSRNHPLSASSCYSDSCSDSSAASQHSGYRPAVCWPAPSTTHRRTHSCPDSSTCSHAHTGSNPDSDARAYASTHTGSNCRAVE
jgi:hypothetical protein